MGRVSAAPLPNMPAREQPLWLLRLNYSWYGRCPAWNSDRSHAKETPRAPTLWRKRKLRKNRGRHENGENLRANPSDSKPGELSTTAAPSEVGDLQEAIEKDGGKVLASYRDPFGGQWLILAALPIEKVEPTPYQRNLSDNHARKLESVIAKLGRFLDPIIVVRKENKESETNYWTPNGNHRLSAMRTLGAKSIIAIVVPEASAAYHILALNTEKAHNLRERALEVIKMYQELATLDDCHGRGLRFGIRRSSAYHAWLMLS